MKHLNFALMDFLGENLAGLITKNWKIWSAKKEAKVYRLCMDKRKIERNLRHGAN